MTDLRERVLAAVAPGETPKAAARRFAVGRPTAYRWVTAARDEGRRGAKRMEGGPAPRIRGEVETALLAFSGGPHHLSLAGTHGVRVHPATVHRALRRADWTRRKLSLWAAERGREDVAREAWWTGAGDGGGGVAPERLAFLDECGVLTNTARLYGRSPRSARARAPAPFGHRTRPTVFGALGAEGVVGAMGVEAAIGAAVFHAYLDEAPLPELRRTKPDAVLAMDDLPAHKAPRVRALLDASGFACRCLPPYSPNSNPIEPIWAKVKAELRRPRRA